MELTVGNIHHQRRTLWNHAWGNQPQVQNGHTTGNNRRHQEIEHFKAQHTHIGGYRHDQQIRRRTDRRAHAADQSRQAHRQQDTRGFTVTADCGTDEHRQHQHNDRRIVHEGAQDSANNQCQQQGKLRRPFPQPGQATRNRFQCPGPHQGLTGNHQRTDGNQRLVAKTVEKFQWFDGAAHTFEGEQFKTYNEDNQDGQAGRLQSDVLPGEHVQGHSCHQQHRRRVGVRNIREVHNRQPRQPASPYITSTVDLLVQPITMSHAFKNPDVQHPVDDFSSPRLWPGISERHAWNHIASGFC